MTQHIQAASESYPQVLDALAAESPASGQVIESLRGLVTARAALAESLDLPGIASLLEKDKSRFLQGAPLLPRTRIPLDAEAVRRCREKLVPEMARAFFNAADAILALDAAFASGRMRLPARLKSFLAKDALPEKKALEAAGTTREVAALYLGQIAKTLSEAVARSVAGTANGQEALQGWTKGYCPVCGSAPEISYLEGKEGRRRLGCSQCGTTWRYTRVACPSCESTDHDQIELFYLDGKAQERADACHLCRRYILHVDRRELSREFIPALEPLGLLHLDMIMQKKGFTPASAEPAVAG
jgi:FdhE protein